MAHTTIYFLTEVEGFDEAEGQVNAHLESENFFDYFNVLPDQSGSLEKMREELDAFIAGYDWRKSADDFLNEAEKYKAEGSLGLYGYYLINAGQLFAQHLSIDTYVYNIGSGDYSIPDNDFGWWVIAVDFHY
jgi:hypothetical protein